MDTNVEMTEIEETTQKSPTPSTRSGRSGSARGSRKTRSLSRKTTPSTEGRTSQVSPEDEGGSVIQIMGPAEESISSPSLDDASEEVVKEKMTKAERFCRKKEKRYPEVGLRIEDTNAWPELSDTLRTHDEDQVKAQNENIDTLLVLSGLFSAVVATLVIEALKLLQRDPVDTTAQLLLQISMQLSSLSVNPGFINSTYVPPPPTPFSPSANAIVVNVLWFISLVLSLVTASLGMLVKQWFREFLAKSNVSPEQCCQVRQFRIPGLRKYKVTEIAGFLPIILQVAFVLFFIGLILFIRPIHTSVSNFISVFVSIWLSFIVVTTFTPLISPSCPYKTPVLKSVFFFTRNRMNGLCEWVKSSAIGPRFRFLPDQLFVEESTSDMSVETKTEVLVETYETFRDIKSWDIMMRCVDLNSPLVSLRILSLLVERMHGSEITYSSKLDGLFDQAQLRLLLKSMVACLRKACVLVIGKNGSTRLTQTDAAAVIILEGLFPHFCPSGQSDQALDEMMDHLRAVEYFSIPHDPGFTSSLILLNSGLPSRELPLTIESGQMSSVIRYATQAIGRDPEDGAGFRCIDSLPHLLEISRVSLLCAGRSVEKYRDHWEPSFLYLTSLLMYAIRDISYPGRSVDTLDVFRAQCALDMAMRVYVKVPGVVDESVLETLHEYSIKMFEAQAESKGWYQHGTIERKNSASGTVPVADWKKVLRGEGYVGVQIHDGHYGYEWDDQELRSSCKQRIEFIWFDFRRNYKEEFRSILTEFEVESGT